LVSVNLSQSILSVVLHSAALCIRLRNILRKWFVTTVLNQVALLTENLTEPQKRVETAWTDRLCHSSQVHYPKQWKHFKQKRKVKWPPSFFCVTGTLFHALH